MQKGYSAPTIFPAFVFRLLRAASARRFLLLCAVLSLVVWLPGCDSMGGDDTPPKVTIKSPLANARIGGTVTLEATASDDSGVEKVEFYVNDQRIGTSIAAPWTHRWNTLNFAEGNHLLQARAYDAAGNEGESAVVRVEVGRPLEFTFINRVFTDIAIEVEGKAPRSIPAGENATYYFDVNPEQISYTAETAGQTSDGNRIGLKINWRNQSIDVEGNRTRKVSLVLSNDFFFLYMRNDGNVRLGPLYVNYGLSSQTKDNLLLPPDGTKYRIGYYRAYTNTQVRTYVENGNGQYVYWNQGTHFDLPFTQNQSVTLFSTYDGSSMSAGRGVDESYTEAVGSSVMARPLQAAKLPPQTFSDEEGLLHFGEAEK